MRRPQRLAILPTSLRRTIPVPADENALFIDECDSTSGWTAAGTGTATLSQSGGELTLSGGTGNAKIARKDCSLGALSNDVCIVFRYRIEHGTNKYGHVILYSATGATSPQIEVNFGYDYPGSAAVAGTISTFNYNASSSDVLVTGLDYSGGVDVCIHIDRDRSCVNFFILGADGKWDFCGSYTHWAAASDIDSVSFGIGTASAATSASLDYIMVCRPNYLAIGDSICAGATLFNPNPATYGGEDDYDSTWMRHAKLGRRAGLRNSLIVNKGIGSQSSTQLQARIAEATAHSARVIFLHASTNDEALAVSQATRTSNIQASVDSIVAAGAKCVLLNAVYGTAACADNTPTPDLLDYMRAWWVDSLPSISGVLGKIDIMQALKDYDGVFQRAAITQADGLHPTPTGYQALGELIAAYEQ